MKQGIIVAALMLGQPAIAATAASAVENFILGAHRAAVGPDAATHRMAGMSGLSSWVEDVQIRQNTESTINPFASGASTAYEFRLMPKAWGQRAAEQGVLGARAALQEAQRKDALNGALYRRYLVLLDFLAQRAAAQHLIISSSVLEGDVQINRSLVGSREFSAKRLLDAEVALARSRGLAGVSLRRLNALRFQLDLPPSSEAQVLADDKPDWLIDHRQIRQTIGQELSLEQMPAVTRLRLEVERVSFEADVIKARQRLGIVSLSAEYTVGANNSNSTENRTQFMVSLNIPLGSGNFKSINSQYAVREAQAAYQQRQAADLHSLGLMRTSMLQWLDEWELIQASLQKNAGRLTTTAAKTDPELVLTLRTEQIRQLKELADVEQKAMAAYIDYLYLSGLLAEQPLRNWIRQGSPAIPLS